MSIFNKLSISDRDWMMEILQKEGTLSADFSFGNLFMWLGQKGIYVTRIKDRLIMKFGTGWNTRFYFPVGSGPLEPAIAFIYENAKKEGAPIRIESVTDESKALLEKSFPGKFEFFEKRDSFDYIYEAETFTEMREKSFTQSATSATDLKKTMNGTLKSLRKSISPTVLGYLPTGRMKWALLPRK